MRYMEHLDGVLGLIDHEFGEMERNGKFRNRDDVELVYKMMDVVKDAAEYCEKFMEMDDDYSEEGRAYRNNRAYENRAYENRAYENRANRRREGGRRRYSIAGDYVEQLRELMQNAPDENTRQNIQRMIQQME